MIADREVLEVLRRAEATLLDPDKPYDYMTWSMCTCGHLFTAVHGRYANPVTEEASEPVDDNGVYVGTLLVVAQALGMKEDRSRRAHTLGGFAADYISQLTARRAMSFDYRNAALSIVRDAIRKIEQYEEEARLNVLVQTEREAVLV